MDQDHIAELVDQAKGRDEQMLLSGLTVLTKDLAEYFAATGHGGEDAQLLHGVYSGALGKERDYWMTHGPQLFQTLREAGLPQGFAADAVHGRPDLTRLSDTTIVHEWTSGPGRDLLERFGASFKDTICGTDGPYEQLQNGLLGQAGLPASIAASIVTSGLASGTFWLPLAVYLGLLISKATLKTYCESGSLAQA